MARLLFRMHSATSALTTTQRVGACSRERVRETISRPGPEDSFTFELKLDELIALADAPGWPKERKTVLKNLLSDDVPPVSDLPVAAAPAEVVLDINVGIVEELEIDATVPSREAT
jgi:hypothetical protein